MKILLSLLFVGFAFADLGAKDVQGPIEDIVEKIRKVIPEPIKFEKLDLVIPENIFVSGSLNVTNFISSGLKAFTFKFNLVPLSIKMGLEKFSLDTQYAMDLPLLKIPLLSIFGDGSLRILVSKVSINCGMDLAGIKSGNVIKSFDIDISNIEFAITGILDDVGISKQISDVINKNTIQLFHKYSKEISQLIKTVLNKVIDAVINKNKTLSVNEGADIFYESGYSPSLWEALEDMLTSSL